ncbi:SEC-C domain-containing protein [Kribbella sp. NPDC055110]
MEGEPADQHRKPEPDTHPNRACSPLDAAREHARHKEHDQATAIWQELIAGRGDSSSDAAADYADYVIRQQHDDIESSAIQEAVSKSGSSPFAQLWAGSVLERRGQLVDALIWYSRTIGHLTDDEIRASRWATLMAGGRRRVKWALGLELDSIDMIGEIGDVEAMDGYFDLLDILRLPTIVDGRVQAWSRAEFAEARESWPSRITPSSVVAYYRAVEGVLREYDEHVTVELMTFENFMDRVMAYRAGSGDDLSPDESNPDEAVGVRWPPGRNQPCWCGSESKYKRCCGTGEPPGPPQAWGPAGLRAGAELAVGRV